MGKMPLVKIQGTKLAADAAEPTLQRFASVDAMIKAMKPAMPVHCLHADALTAAAKTFLAGFPGQTLFAVKCNPTVDVLRILAAAGVKHFDVASVAEMALVTEACPGAPMAFMHPIKSRESIRTAYFDYGVRDFSVDTFEELHKVFEETGSAADLTIHVRLATNNPQATQNLSAKFGATPADAAQLLRDAKKIAKRVGLCFHVGSQSTDPEIYRTALRLAGEVIAASGVAINVLDVGGGFPAQYADGPVPELAVFFAVIKEELARLKLPKNCEVWAEPGRALVAAGETLVTRVDLRKGDALYLNDGLYGTLFDAAFFNQKNPARLVRAGRKVSSETAPFRLFGPTCDSEDVMEGPYMLPKDAREGDWLVFGMHGAYGRAIQTNFNGFAANHVLVEIDPNLAVQKPAAKPAARKLTLVRGAREVVTQ